MFKFSRPSKRLPQSDLTRLLNLPFPVAVQNSGDPILDQYLAEPERSDEAHRNFPTDFPNSEMLLRGGMETIGLRRLRAEALLLMERQSHGSTGPVWNPSKVRTRLIRLLPELNTVEATFAQSDLLAMLQTFPNQRLGQSWDNEHLTPFLALMDRASTADAPSHWLKMLSLIAKALDAEDKGWIIGKYHPLIQERLYLELGRDPASSPYLQRIADGKARAQKSIEALRQVLGPVLVPLLEAFSTTSNAEGVAETVNQLARVTPEGRAAILVGIVRYHQFRKELFSLENRSKSGFVIQHLPDFLGFDRLLQTVAQTAERRKSVFTEAEALELLHSEHEGIYSTGQKNVGVWRWVGHALPPGSLAARGAANAVISAWNRPQSDWVIKSSAYLLASFEPEESDCNADDTAATHVEANRAFSDAIDALVRWETVETLKFQTKCVAADRAWELSRKPYKRHADNRLWRIPFGQSELIAEAHFALMHAAKLGPPTPTALAKLDDMVAQLESYRTGPVPPHTYAVQSAEALIRKLTAGRERATIYLGLSSAERTALLAAEDVARDAPSSARPSNAWRKKSAARMANINQTHLIGAFQVLLATLTPFLPRTSSRTAFNREAYDPIVGLIWMAGDLPPADLVNPLTTFATHAIEVVPGVGLRAEKLATACFWSLAALPGGSGRNSLKALRKQAPYPKIQKAIDKVQAAVASS